MISPRVRRPSFNGCCCADRWTGLDRVRGHAVMEKKRMTGVVAMVVVLLLLLLLLLRPLLLLRFSSPPARSEVRISRPEDKRSGSVLFVRLVDR